MRRHAKAATAGPTRHQAKRLGGLARGAAVAAAFALLALVFAASASATQFQRPFKETFGSAAQPSFEWPATLAVDPATGDLLVGDFRTSTIQRFHPDGTPAPFAALGSNTIDGKEGAKPCAEEPASCDKTLQNEIEVSDQYETQIAIDNSGGSTDGDIYLTQRNSNLVDIFSSEGRYLGQLTAAGFTNFVGPCGVAVDPDGAVYIPGGEKISKFVPTGNPPVNTDNTANFLMPIGKSPPFRENICAIAIGTGPTANWIFGTNGGNANGERIYKINKESGEVQYTFAEEEGFSLGPTAVDPTTGHVIVTGVFKGREHEAVEFDASGSSGAVQVARLVDKKGNGIRGLAAGSGNVYVALGPVEPQIEVYGAPAAVPTVTADPASNVTGSKATLTGTVNPEGLEVTECFFKYGETTSYGNEAPCEGSIIPTDSSPHPVHLDVSGLEPNGHTYHFRLFATNENGTEESADQTLVTAQTVETQAATGIGTATATLNGTVRPEGDQYTACFFEYGLSSNASLEKTAPCNPGALGIEADFSPHAASAAIGGLQKGTAYRFRLVATNSEGTLKGEEFSFTTLGAPQISGFRASFADQGSATLEAKINPSGFGTSYRFEWGPTASYGNSIPADFEPFVGSGTEPVQVRAKISGLAAATTYHYRVVATNSVDVTESPDQVFETLNSCGLPEGRCFEMVSPQEVGPVGRPGQTPFEAELHFQAAPEPGSLAYILESGLPDSTTGAEVLYRGTRSASGWSSKQLSAPIIARSETSSNSSFSGVTYGLSPNLSCGVLVSNQPLSGDASTELVREAGGSNLYRHNPDGSYTAISKLAPENLDAVSGFIIAEYKLVAMSDDCGKVIFNSEYRYPGVPSPGGQVKLYEWDEGTLRSLSYVPGPSGETLVEPTIGVGGSGPGLEDTIHLVSADGSRVFFSAQRQTSPNPEEIGKGGIFVREDGTSTRDLSLSETSTPDEGATYQWASKDGSRVFFTANAGLTAESSPEGTDLYEYDLENDALTDLSVDHEAGGAQVTDFIGGSEDGSHVYFIAQGQLVPGKGKTLAQNKSDHTYSVYGEEDGAVGYVATIGEDDLSSISVTRPARQTSRVSPDGRYLVFQSKANVTGYESGGAGEVYLYDAGASSEAIACVSCRQDGKSSLEPDENLLLPRGGNSNPLYAPRSLVVRDGKPQVFFNSYDRLASGAVEGSGNVYEWSHGQVFHIATEPPGINGRPEEFDSLGPFAEFVDAAADGTDLYLATPASLNWEDKDGRYSVYDARIGGGFPEPPSSAPCDPKSEGSCEGATSPGPASTPTPSSSTFNGPGNAKPKAQQKKKRHKRHHRKRKAGHAKHKRDANGNRRAGK